MQLRGFRHSLLGLSRVCSPPRWSLLHCPARIAEGTEKDGQTAALSCMEVCSDASIPLFCSFILWGRPSGASEVRDWAIRRSASWRLTHHCGRGVYGHSVKGWAAGPGLTHPLGFQGSCKWWQKSYWRLNTFHSMYIKRRRAIPIFRIKKNNNNSMTSCSLMQGKTFFSFITFFKCSSCKSQGLHHFASCSLQTIANNWAHRGQGMLMVYFTGCPSQDVFSNWWLKGEVSARLFGEPHCSRGTLQPLRCVRSSPISRATWH